MVSTRTYVWSDAGRLTNRGTDTLGYDGLDRMNSSTVAGTARTYASNGDRLLQSRTGSCAASFLSVGGNASAAGLAPSIPIEIEMLGVEYILLP